jgi:hypothetical protein
MTTSQNWEGGKNNTVKTKNLWRWISNAFLPWKGIHQEFDKSTYLPTNLRTNLPTYLFTYRSRLLRTYLHIYPPTYRLGPTYHLSTYRCLCGGFAADLPLLLGLLQPPFLRLVAVALVVVEMIAAVVRSVVHRLVACLCAFVRLLFSDSPPSAPPRCSAPPVSVCVPACFCPRCWSEGEFFLGIVYFSLARILLGLAV